MRRAGRAWGNRWVVLYAWRPDAARPPQPADAGGRDGVPAAGHGPAAGVGAGGPTRIGITVGRRLGKAVRRNRVRRLLAEAFRRLAPRVAPGWWLVVVARDAAADLDWETACRALEDVLRKARLLRPPVSGGLRGGGGEARPRAGAGAAGPGAAPGRQRMGSGREAGQGAEARGAARSGASDPGGGRDGSAPGAGTKRAATEPGGRAPC